MIQMLTHEKLKNWASMETWRLKSAGCGMWRQKLCQL